MDYSIKVQRLDEPVGSTVARVSVTFGGSFKVTGISIMENKEKNSFFVSMPRYKSNSKDENGANIYKDICHPVTAEFRERLYGDILQLYDSTSAVVPIISTDEATKNLEDIPKFTLSISAFNREDGTSNGSVQLCLDNSFVVSNIRVREGKNGSFVSMPCYETKQKNEDGSSIYQDICYPVTAKFREKLYGEILGGYEKAKTEPKKTAPDNETKTTEAKTNPRTKKENSKKEDKSR